MVGLQRYLPINFAPPPDFTGRGFFIHSTVCFVVCLAVYLAVYLAV
jgi:hypothetical protein